MSVEGAHDVVVVQRRRGTLGVPALIAALGLAVVAYAWLSAPLHWLLPYGALSWLLGLFLFGVSLRTNPMHHERRTAVTAAGGRLLEHGNVLVDRSELVEGYVQPSSGRALLRLRGRKKRLELRVERIAAAHELLRGLHLDANEARVTFWAPSPVVAQPAWQAVFVALWALTLGLLGTTAHPHDAFFSFVPFLVTYFACLAVPTRIVTGPDGVRADWLGFGRFVPYSSIHSITEDEAAVHVRAAGKALVLRFKPPRWASKNDWFFEWIFREQKTALHDRLTEGLGVRPRETSEDVRALLSRGGLSTTEWLASLRALGSRGVRGYRRARIPRELLWGVAESPSADPDARVAAAVALRVDLDDGERTRLRAVADATVAPKLRIALANVLADEEDKLSLALDDADEETRERRRGA